MWNTPAHYRNPVALFTESASASSKHSQSSPNSDDDDEDEEEESRRTFLELMAVMPGRRGAERVTVAAAGAPHGQWSNTSNANVYGGGAEPNHERGHASWWRQRQRERRDHRYFAKRGALDYDQSTVFTPIPADSSGRNDRDGSLDDYDAAMGVALAEATYARPQRHPHDGPERSGVFTTSGPEVCVPEELQAWYMVSNSVAAPRSPSATRGSSARRRRKKGRRVEQEQQQKAAAAAAGSAEEVFLPTGTVATDTGEPRADRIDAAGGEPGSGAVVLRPSLRSSGAGTTAVDVLRSRAATEAASNTPATCSSSTGTTSSSGNPLSGEADVSGHPCSGTPVDQLGNVQFDEEDISSSCSTSSGDGGSGRDAASSGKAVTPRGGRPPLRAHRYVEQPNGAFLSHAQHADLLAHYAVEEGLRLAQEKEDAYRARRWSRLLHGRRGKHGADRTPDRYEWMYDGATFRPRMVALLHHLQRVHVFLVAVAAGMSLLTLLAITVPSPVPTRIGVGTRDSSGGVEESAGGDHQRGPPLLLLLAAVTQGTSSQANATVQVFPVFREGSPAFAIFMALLQPYHAALLLSLCLLLVITGYAPVPWGVAERRWITQRWRWLQQDQLDANSEDAGWNGSAEGRSRMRWGSTVAIRRHGSGGSREFYDNSSATMLGGGSGTTSSGYRGPRRRLAAAHLGNAAAPAGGVGTMEDASRSHLFAATTATNALFSPDDRLAFSLGLGTDHGGGVALAHRRRHDPLRYSLTFGASTAGSGHGTSSQAAAMGSGFDHSFLSASHQIQPRRGEGGHFPTDSTDGDLLSRGGSHQVSPLGGTASPTWRAHPFAHPGHHDSSTGSVLSGSLLADGLGGHRRHLRNNAQPPWTASGLSRDWTSRGFSSTSRRRAAEGTHAAPSTAPASVPPALLLLSMRTLEGGLSPDNAFSRTFDYVQRSVMLWLCRWLRRTTALGWCCCRGGGSGGARDDGHGTRLTAAAKRYWENSPVGGGGALALPSYLSGLHVDPVTPCSLYLHVLLQPRLWCVVVALVLTIVELAFVDERGLALLWMAQPASWWSSAAATVTVPLTSVVPSDLGGGAGHVWRVLLGVYATRMAALWTALLLNIFC